MWTKPLFLTLLGLNFWVLTGVSLAAADVALKVTEKSPPAELSPELRAALQSKAIQVIEGQTPLWEFWLATSVPVSAAPASSEKAMDQLQQAALLGAVHIPKDQRDYRDDELPAGTYTVRFGLQPQDGNHLGTSEFTYFAVLIPAKHDTKPDGIATYKAMAKASSRDTSTEHPLILSLRPVKDAGSPLPRITEPAPEHKSARIELPGKSGDKAVPIAVDLVFEGKAKE